MKITLPVMAFMLAVLARPSAAATDHVFEGIYIWGSEVETFSPCGAGRKEWWVDTSDAIWKRLRDDTLRLVTQPYEGIYVKLVGHYDGPATEERGGAFATQYEGMFKVTRILSVRKTGKSDCKGVVNPAK